VNGRRFRWLGLTCGVAALLAVAACWFLFAPTGIGGSVDYAVIDGTSMEPHLHGGDLVLLHTRNQYSIGDAVGYHNEQLGRVVLHRIVGRVGDRYVFKGDNNNFLDSYHPTRSQLIGTLWLQVPGGGRPVSWLHKPVDAAIAVGLVALLLLGGGGVEARRRRRRLVDRPRDRLQPGSGTAPWGAGLAPGIGRSVLAASALVGVLFGLLALLGYGHATTRQVSVAGAYLQQGRYRYSAQARPGAVYANGKVGTGQTVFTRLAQHVQVGFGYRFVTALRHDLSGTASLNAILSSSLGWSRPLPGASSRFRGDAVDLSTTLDLSALEEQIARYYQTTGVPSDNFTVTVTPQVVVHGTIDGQQLTNSFAPTPLLFTIDKYSLRLQQAPLGGQTPGQPAADPFQPSAPGSIDRRSPRTLALLAAKPRVTTIRRIGLLGLLAAALLGLAGAALQLVARRAADELSMIRRRYGDALVAVSLPPAPPASGYIDVPSFESLARLALGYERLILHAQQARMHSFYLDDGGFVYRYRLGTAESPLSPVRPVAEEQPSRTVSR
jgi:signal peptidase I